MEYFPDYGIQGGAWKRKSGQSSEVLKTLEVWLPGFFNELFAFFA
jgi:hypothetical protein